VKTTIINYGKQSHNPETARTRPNRFVLEEPDPRSINLIRALAFMTFLFYNIIMRV